MVAAATIVVLAVYTATVTTVGATAATFGSGVAWQTWVLSGMSLGLAGALLTTGAVADLYGHRRVFALSCLALALTSALGAVAPSMLVVVVARVLQGAAGAGALAAGLGLLGATFPTGAARTHATAMWGAALAGGIALGPVAAAGLTDVWGWRSSYWVMALGAALVGVAARGLPDPPEGIVARRLDLPGAVTLIAAMLALTAGITSGRSDWTSAPTLALLAVGVAALAAFAAVERRRAEPMLELGLLRRALFAASISGAAVTGLATIALMSYLPSVLQRGVGLTALASGAVLAFWSGTSMVAATQVRRLPERIDARTRLAVGLAGNAVGCAALVLLRDGSGWWVLVPGLLIAGIGSGLANAALARLAVQSVPEGSGGLGSGANNTARYLGSALGIALVVAIVAGGGSVFTGWDRAALYGGAVNLLGAGLVIAARPDTST